jgi:hypothetical protein
MFQIRNICLSFNKKLAQSPELVRDSDVKQICNGIVKKWGTHTNDEIMSIMNKSCFVNDIELVFTCFYNYYGCENTMNDLENIIEDDPSFIEEIDEYKVFVSNLRTIAKFDESDIIDSHSEYFVKIKLTLDYLAKQLKYIEDINEAMSTLDDRLQEFITYDK